MNPLIARIARRVLEGRPAEPDEALFLAGRTGQDGADVLYWAGAIRRRFMGERVATCSIISARQGRCSEDCAFCPQSVHHHAEIDEFPLIETDRIVAAAGSARSAGADSFGIVTSGRGMGGPADLDAIGRAVERVAALPLKACASLGQVTEAEIAALKARGLRRLHHNLETSRSFYPRICSTQSWDDRAATVRRIKAAGLEVCSGALFGLGETWQDRIDLAATLRGLDVDSVPLNFLVPRPGTPLADAEPLAPMEILRIIAVYRFLLPDRELKVCGGRPNLRDLQSWIFEAGASGMMIGNYLTTLGRPPETDRQMVRDLGLSLGGGGEPA